MNVGDIAEGIFGISIGILCIALSFFRKNDQSEDAKFIRKYNKQLLLILGILSIITGTQYFIDGRRSEPTPEKGNFAHIPAQSFKLDDTNNSIYVTTTDEQSSNHRKE